MANIRNAAWGARLLGLLLLPLSSLSGAQSPDTPVRYAIQGNELVLQDPLVFAADSADLLSSSLPGIQQAASYLARKQYVSLLRIEGHASTLELSTARAAMVANALVDAGVACERLMASGFADTKPLVALDSPGAAEINTRITLVNAELNGRAIGGMPIEGGALKSLRCTP